MIQTPSSQTLPAAPFQSVPFIPGLPLIGNLWAFKQDRLALFSKIYRQFGDIGGYTVGPLKFILFNNADYVQWLLTEQHQHFERSPVILLMKPVLGNGLLTADNTLNHQQRKILNPAFHPERISSYANVITECTTQWQEKLKDGQRIGLSREMMGLTLEIIAKCLFNADIRQDAKDLGTAITVLLKHSVDRLNSLIPLPLNWPLPSSLRLQNAIRQLDKVVYRIIHESPESFTAHNGVLSLLSSHAGLDERQIRDEIMTLLLAGHETTANALTWTYYLLTKHPEVYDRLQHEVVSALNGRQPAYEDLSRLSYTRQVFKEAMRLFPPVYAFGRQSLHDMTLDGFRLPKGVVINVSPYILHRRPDYFPNPECFDPDRFAPEREARIPKFAYLPFGAGPRMCIGKYFAMAEGPLILATLAQQLRFHQADEQEVRPKAMMTLRPQSEIYMRVTRL